MGHKNFRIVYQGGPDGGGIEIVDPAENETKKSTRRSQAAVRLILLILADKANDEGDPIVWPSLATLSAYSRLDEKTVRRSLRTLERAGLLELTKEASKIRRRTREYRLMLPAMTEPTPEKSGSEPVNSASLAGSEPVNDSKSDKTETGSESLKVGSESRIPDSESQLTGSEGTPTLPNPKPSELRRSEEGVGEGDSSSQVSQSRASALPESPTRKVADPNVRKKIEVFEDFIGQLRQAMSKPLDFDEGDETNRNLVIERIEVGWSLEGLAQRVNSERNWTGTKHQNKVLTHRLSNVPVSPDDKELLDQERRKLKAEEAARKCAAIVAIAEHPACSSGSIHIHTVEAIKAGQTISDDSLDRAYTYAEDRLRRAVNTDKKISVGMIQQRITDPIMIERFISEHQLDNDYPEPIKAKDVPEALRALERLQARTQLDDCAIGFDLLGCQCSKVSQG